MIPFAAIRLPGLGLILLIGVTIFLVICGYSFANDMANKWQNLKARRKEQAEKKPQK